MRSRGADRPDDEADQRNEQPGKSRRLFGRGRPEPAEPEEVPREETGWLDDLRSAKQERAAIGPGKPTDGKASKSGKVAPGPRDEPPEPPAEPRSAAAPSSPAGPPDSAPFPFGRSGVTGRPVSSSPAAPTSGAARARFEGEQAGQRAAGESTGGWRTTDQASGRHTSAFSLGDLSADEPTPGHGRRAIDPGQMSGRDRRAPSAGPTSGAPIPGRPVSAGPVSAGPVSAGPVSAGPVSAVPLSGNAPEVPPVRPTSPPRPGPQSRPGSPVYPGSPAHPGSPAYSGSPGYSGSPVHPRLPVPPGSPTPPGLPIPPGPPIPPGSSVPPPSQGRQAGSVPGEYGGQPSGGRHASGEFVQVPEQHRPLTDRPVGRRAGRPQGAPDVDDSQSLYGGGRPGPDDSQHIYGRGRAGRSGSPGPEDSQRLYGGGRARRPGPDDSQPLYGGVGRAARPGPEDSQQLYGGGRSGGPDLDDSQPLHGGARRPGPEDSQPLYGRAARPGPDDSQRLYGGAGRVGAPGPEESQPLHGGGRAGRPGPDDSQPLYGGRRPGPDDSQPLYGAGGRTAGSGRPVSALPAADGSSFGSRNTGAAGRARPILPAPDPQPGEGTGRHGIPEPGSRSESIAGRAPAGPGPDGRHSGPIPRGQRPENTPATGQPARASAAVVPPVVPGRQGARTPAVPGRAGAMADSPSGVIKRPGETTGRVAGRRSGRIPRPGQPGPSTRGRPQPDRQPGQDQPGETSQGQHQQDGPQPSQGTGWQAQPGRPPRGRARPGAQPQPADVSQAFGAVAPAFPGDVSQPIPGRGSHARPDDVDQAPGAADPTYPGDVSRPILGRASAASVSPPLPGDVSQPILGRASAASVSPPLPGDVSQPILGRADTTAPGHISQPLPGQAGRARPVAGSSPVRGTGSVSVPERAVAAASVPAAAVPPHVEDRPAPGATEPLDRTGAVVRPAAVAEPDDEAEAVLGEIRGGRSEWGKQLRAKRRLRVITLVTLSVLVLGLLPLFFGIRAATRDPVFNSLDALDVPGWAATEIDDRSSGSRWCFLDCRFRERTAQSDRPFEETANVYSDALIIAGWKPWQVGACPEQPVTDGRYTCWRRDEFTLDLWVRLPECAVDAFAAQDPATLPSPGPDGVVETAKPESCVGSTVSIKVQNAITDQRGKPEQRPNPSLVGETPDPVLSNDPLLDPTPSPS